jgi:sulfate transporter 4
VQYLLGYKLKKSQYVHDTVADIFSQIEKINGWTMMFGIIWILALLILKKLSRRYPRLSFLGPCAPLLCCVVGRLMVSLSDDVQDKIGGKLGYVSEIPSGLPPFSVGDWSLGDIPLVLPTAVSSALIGFMESIAIGKSLAAKHGYELPAGQELVALGLSNVVGACFSSYPITGSFSRSAVNNATGARSPMAGLITSICMLVCLAFITSIFEYLPKFCLAAIVINSVIPLVAYQEALHLWQIKKSDCFLWVFAFLGTLFLGVLLGILLAVAASLLIIIYESVRPQLTVLWRLPGTSIYRNVKQESNGSFIPGVMIVRIGASMYFANAAFIKEMLLNFVLDFQDVNPVKYVILEMTSVVSVDSTAVHALEDLIKDFKANRQIQISFCMLGNRVEKTFRKAKLDRLLGSKWIFPRVHDAVQDCVKHQNAKALKASFVRTESVEVRDETRMSFQTVTVGEEVGWSNTMDAASTVVFFTAKAERPGLMMDVTSVFSKYGVDVRQASVDERQHGVRHVYMCQDVITRSKLEKAVIDRVVVELKSTLFAKSNQGDKISAAEPVTRLDDLEQGLEAQRQTTQTLMAAIQQQSTVLAQLVSVKTAGTTVEA